MQVNDTMNYLVTYRVKILVQRTGLGDGTAGPGPVEQYRTLHSHYISHVLVEGEAM